MGLGESALILLGIGIVSQKFGAGLGLEQLGTGIKTLAAAPLGGVGLGLGEFSGGLRSFAETLGDVGRGFGTLFENIPTFPGAGPQGGLGGGGGGARNLPTPDIAYWGPARPLIMKAGGGGGDLLPGGGGSTPRPTAPIPRQLPPRPAPLPSQPRYTPRPITMTDDRLRNVVML